MKKYEFSCDNGIGDFKKFDEFLLFFKIFMLVVLIVIMVVVVVCFFLFSFVFGLVLMFMNIDDVKRKVIDRVYNVNIVFIWS